MSNNKKDVLLQVEHLHKAYGDHVVLDDVSLEVERGEVIVIIGPSGCGKSTFLRCLNALEPIQGGKVSVAGKSVDGSERDLVELRQKVGMVFQSYDLFPHMTVLDNITLAPMKARGVAREAAEEQARALLERVGLAEKAESYPRQLSGGQKQRVAIARALATNPQVLLCDEATSALDPATTDSILSLIKDINRDLGITAVIITHEMSVIEKICSHVAIIHRGKIVEHGEVEEVFFHPRTEAARRLVMPEALQNLPQENLYRLIFNGRSSFEPVIANMVLECHCPVNIMYADTRDIGGIAFGQMVLQLPECPESRRSILEFAKSRNILLEEMKHV